MVLGSNQAVRRCERGPGSEPRVTDGASGPSEELTGSDDTALLGLLSQVKAAEEEGAQVDGLEAALQHHLCHSPPHGGGLLEPVAAEACRKVHVDDEGVRAHHAILVKGVVVVVAGPSAPNLRGTGRRVSGGLPRAPPHPLAAGVGARYPPPPLSTLAGRVPWGGGTNTAGRPSRGAQVLRGRLSPSSYLQSLKSWHPPGQTGPHLLLEESMVHFQVPWVWFLLLGAEVGTRLTLPGTHGQTQASPASLTCPLGKWRIGGRDPKSKPEGTVTSGPALGPPKKPDCSATPGLCLLPSTPTPQSSPQRGYSRPGSCCLILPGGNRLRWGLRQAEPPGLVPGGSATSTHTCRDQRR